MKEVRLYDDQRLLLLHWLAPSSTLLFLFRPLVSRDVRALTVETTDRRDEHRSFSKDVSHSFFHLLCYVARHVLLFSEIDDEEQQYDIF